MARSTVYNENLTSDYEKVSPQNRQLVKQYIQYCKSNDKYNSSMKHGLKCFFVGTIKKTETSFLSI